DEGKQLVVLTSHNPATFNWYQVDWNTLALGGDYRSKECPPIPGLHTVSLGGRHILSPARLPGYLNVVTLPHDPYSPTQIATSGPKYTGNFRGAALSSDGNQLAIGVERDGAFFLTIQQAAGPDLELPLSRDIRSIFFLRGDRI